ncbi:MAG: TIGR00730 family Rossman fold protein [Alphaproteobacteria bacterium]
MNDIKTLTVYLGSSGHARDVFQNCATAMGGLIGEAGMRLVYGGMDAGLMGRVARAALDAGAHVTGIVPRKLKDSERILNNLSDTVMVEDLWDRKKRMFRAADAIVTLPGGYGTADEALEVLYWGNLGLHNKPLVLVNIEGYWDDFIAYLKTLPDFDPRFLIVVAGVDDVIPALRAFEPPPAPAEDPDHYPHFEDEIARDTKEPILVDIASVENSYYAICALGLKQLHKHRRGIGFLNEDGAFDGFLAWIARAAVERFITQDCLKLFTVGREEGALREALRSQAYVEIDLHEAKWGKREG